MQTFKPQRDLNESFPDEFFIKVLFEFLLVDYFLVQITVIRKLHHYAVLNALYQSEFDSMKACL